MMAILSRLVVLRVDAMITIETELNSTPNHEKRDFDRDIHEEKETYNAQKAKKDFGQSLFSCAWQEK